MIHHMSFAVRDPRHVAQVLAGITGAAPLRAPSPPFPSGSWLLCFGDRGGTMLELLPAGFVLDPDAPLGVTRGEPQPRRSACHVLVGSAVPQPEVLAIAAREGWRTQAVDAGLFEIVKLWVEDAFLVELLAPEKAHRYIETFGRDGLPSLDAKLRRVEAEMAAVLAQKLPPGALAEAIGSPAG